MIGTLAGFFVEHWALALVASAAGAFLGLAYLAAEYLILPLWHLHAARRRGPASVDTLIGYERRRLWRLENDAAVLGERGHPDAEALHEEAELRRLVVEVLERSTKGR